ncbi:MAG: hypothetical protein ACYDD4_11400, partial [Acidimicrobiales bacterium]
GAADTAASAGTTGTAVSPARTAIAVTAVTAAATAVVALHDAAPALLVIGVAAVVADDVARSARGRVLRRSLGELQLTVLVALFVVAVAGGVLGRAWRGPSWLLAHCGSWAVAPIAALCSIVVNNLPAASVLAARVPAHPLELLVGLNLGPNLAVTGSLSALLWWRSAAAAGARPSARAVSALGIFVAPLSMMAAVAAVH